MRRVVPIAAFLILAWIGAWLAFRGSTRETASSELERRTALAADAPLALRESGAAPDTRLAPAPGAGAPRSTAAPPIEPTTGAVWVQAIPDDPVEHGPAALALTVLDEEAGVPQTGTVNLWRLDAPGNAGWLAGDQVQGAIRISEGHGELGDLPEGRYRAVFEEQRAAAGDPAQFEVRGARTEVTLRVPMPRRFQASLRLLDERGQPLRSAELDWGGRRWSKVSAPPPWAHARTLRDASISVPYRFRGGHANMSSGGSAWKPIEAVDDLLPVGDFAEPSRGTRSARWKGVRVEGRSGVDVTLGDGATSPTTHIGVSLPLALLLEHLLLPDGTPALGSAAWVRATCKAELLTPETPPDRWRSMPVRVEVTLDGYEPLEMTADADHPSPLPPPWKRVEEKPPEKPTGAPR